MFDWARGSVLKKLLQEQFPGVNYDIPVKSWENGWPVALLKIPSGTRYLDIGSANPWYAKQIASSYGCEAHVLEQLNAPEMANNFGITEEVIQQNPEITFHIGLAGQDVAPAGYYDLITCISVVEHFYDADSPMNPNNPMPHFNALRDMVRMLAPGGVLVLTYGVFLNDPLPWHHGWDYLGDIAFMERSGMQLLYPPKKARSSTYIYNYEDTLFYGPELIFPFLDYYCRETAIGMMYRKPGPVSKVEFSPHPKLVDVLLTDEDKSNTLFRSSNTAEISRESISKALEKVSTSEDIRLSVFVEQLQAELQQKNSTIEHLQAELQQKNLVIQQTQGMIEAMKSSKLWQLRTEWFKLKRALGFAQDDLLSK